MTIYVDQVIASFKKAESAVKNMRTMIYVLQLVARSYETNDSVTMVVTVVTVGY